MYFLQSTKEEQLHLQIRLLIVPNPAEGWVERANGRKGKLLSQGPVQFPAESSGGWNDNNMSDALANAVCERCQTRFDPAERIVNSNGELYHENCFVCAQCFRQFPDGLFYEFEGRKYCEHDFQMLFAPCCGECGEFIIGRVIKAMNNNWHPECFRCELCDVVLADLGFVKNAGSIEAVF
ncbi:hypothetical protein Q9966_005312 [Columba livia]|nr:hypothetical protein Q9966_005312 [Columba livia]